ncbi:MAG: alkaline phosphatase family protein [Bacteroidales bacterium]|nr:alkaline phosphatase family protein [Bacteroidales bacterium]
MRKMIAYTILFFLIIISWQAPAQNAYIPPERPRLVMGIVIEQFRYDYIDKYRDMFGSGGILKLINEGTFCKNASYDFFLTQSAPAHATLATGTSPRHHGIVADNWYVPLREEIIYCSSDNSVDPIGGSFENGHHSPARLFPSTFADELKMATAGEARVFGLGFREHAAILAAGHTADAAYWYDDITGTWMSSSHYMDSLPSWVNDFNNMGLADFYFDRQWNTLLDMGEYRACLPDTNDYEAGLSGRSVFPYDLKKMSTSSVLGMFNRKKDYSLLEKVPASDTYTTDFAIRLIEEEKLGEDEVTDFLSITFSATDRIGHSYGPSSVEMADAILRLDRNLEHLLSYINDKLGKKNVLVYLTSAHGIAEIPAVLKDRKIPAGYFRHNQAVSLLRSYLNVLYDQGDWIKGYYEKQLYLNHILIEDSGLKLSDVQDAASGFLTQFNGISSAVSGTVLANNEFTRGHFARMRNSFDPTRSGDIIINLKPAWVENGSWITNHNSVYEYDSHVPLIWYGWKVNRSSITRKVNMNELAATLSALCRLPYPNACSGEPMTELYR